LGVDDVKNWKVIGYDAIVLVSAYTYFDVQKEIYVTHTTTQSRLVPVKEYRALSYRTNATVALVT
jgi:hypothetical protein